MKSPIKLQKTHRIKNLDIDSQTEYIHTCIYDIYTVHIIYTYVYIIYTRKKQQITDDQRSIEYQKIIC